MVSVEQWLRMTPKQQWDTYVAAAQVADEAGERHVNDAAKKPLLKPAKASDEHPSGTSL